MPCYPFLRPQSPLIKLMLGNGVWWPLRMGPVMMDASYFAELAPYDSKARTAIDTGHVM